MISHAVVARLLWALPEAELEGPEAWNTDDLPGELIRHVRNAHQHFVCGLVDVNASLDERVIDEG